MALQKGTKERRWCFQKMDLWKTEDCSTCDDYYECFDKTFEEQLMDAEAYI